MSRFDDYADAVIEQIEEHRNEVAAGLIEHTRPLTREQAAEDERLQQFANERFADLTDHHNPESLWY